MGNLEICLQKIKDLPCQYDANLEDMSRLATFRRGFQLFLSRTVCLLIELVFGSAVFYSLCLLYITLLRFSGWERAPRFLSDSSPGISTPWKVQTYNQRVGQFELEDLSSCASSSIHSSVPTASHFSCLCQVNEGKWHLPHRVIRRNCVRHWRVPGTWSTMKASWLPILLWLPIPPSLVLSKEPGKYQGLWRR